MSTKSKKTHEWDSDIAESVQRYNEWFLDFAPKVYRNNRFDKAEYAKLALEWTENLTNLKSDILKTNPSVLSTLRMITAPPIARDRLVGLAEVSRSLVKTMEDDKKLPPKMSEAQIEINLMRITRVISELLDRDLFTWLKENRQPTNDEIAIAAKIIADRLGDAQTDPDIRNAQEKRQCGIVREWLEDRGYVFVGTNVKYNDMDPSTYAFHLDIPVVQGKDTKSDQEDYYQEDEQEDVYQVDDGNREGNQFNDVSVDIVVLPHNTQHGDFPVLIEAKSAGDFTNPNKRRKEEATKIAQLKQTFREEHIIYILFLCGYFNENYLSYEKNHGIKLVWDHRVEDLAKFGV